MTTDMPATNMLAPGLLQDMLQSLIDRYPDSDIDRDHDA